jgi:hypothetical protein
MEWQVLVAMLTRSSAKTWQAVAKKPQLLNVLAN